MKQIATAFAFLVVTAATARAQNEDVNWVFGRRAALNFAGTNPVEVSGTKILGHGGTASVSDAAGSLLFYTDGATAWNRNHQMMPNGTLLGGHISATQAALIVPWPGANCRRYVIFSVGYVTDPGLFYSVVNMTLQGGLGDVEAGAKAVPLQGQVAEKLAAFRTSPSRVVVVAHGFVQGQNSTDPINRTFYAYVVDTTGVHHLSTSVAGAPHTTPTANLTFAAAQGQMKIAPGGTRIASAVRSGLVDVLDFNPATGIVSDPPQAITYNLSGNLPFDFRSRGVYGLEFSPNGTKLYVTTHRTGVSGIPNQLLQLDLLNLQAGWREVASGGVGNDFGLLQLQPINGSIYLARASVNDTAPRRLGVITNANSAVNNGVTFDGAGVPLSPGKPGYGLPSLIQGGGATTACCDHLEVSSIASDPLFQLDYKTFSIHNVVSPPFPICWIDVKVTPSPLLWVGGNLAVDSGPGLGPETYAYPYTRIPATGTTTLVSTGTSPAARLNLGVESSQPFHGTVEFIVHHCGAGPTCTLTHGPWM